MLFTLFDKCNGGDECEWTYYIPLVIADLVVFGYFWWVVKQYRDHKRETDKGTIVELKNEGELWVNVNTAIKLLSIKFEFTED